MKNYPSATVAAALDALKKPRNDRTTRERVLLYLAESNDWVGARELATKCTHKFSSRLSELSASGIPYEKRLHEPRPKGKLWYEYRLAEVEK